MTALRTGIGIRLRPPGSLLGQRAVDTARVCRPRACSVRRAPPAVLCTDKSMAIASVAMAGCVVLLQLLAAVFVWSGNRAVEDEFVAGGDIMDVFTTYDAVSALKFLLLLGGVHRHLHVVVGCARQCRGAEPDCASRA